MLKKIIILEVSMLFSVLMFLGAYLTATVHDYLTCILSVDFAICGILVMIRQIIDIYNIVRENMKNADK